MRPGISMRGCVRPSVRPSVCPSVGRTRVEILQKCRSWPKLLAVRAWTHLMTCIRPCYLVAFLPLSRLINSLSIDNSLTYIYYPSPPLSPSFRHGVLHASLQVLRPLQSDEPANGLFQLHLRLGSQHSRLRFAAQRRHHLVLRSRIGAGHDSHHWQPTPRHHLLPTRLHRPSREDDGRHALLRHHLSLHRRCQRTQSSQGRARRLLTSIQSHVWKWNSGRIHPFLGRRTFGSNNNQHDNSSNNNNKNTTKNYSNNNNNNNNNNNANENKTATTQLTTTQTIIYTTKTNNDTKNNTQQHQQKQTTTTLL